MDPLRTALAAQGVELSALFYVVFEHFELPGSPPRIPRLNAPHGPSTAGGKMARQHISLVPKEGLSGPTVVVGWADSSTHRAELRTYDLVDEIHHQRFGRPLEIPRGVYRRFLRKTEAFLKEHDFTIVEIDQATHSGTSERPTGHLGLWVLVLFTTLILGVCLGMLLMLVNRGLIVMPSP